VDPAAPVAAWNEWQFSTKRRDAIGGGLLYEHRAYLALLGRWGSRDPLAENGGLNPYGFIDNAAINFFDLDGLEKGSARGGATDLMGLVRPAYPGLDINPIDGLRMILGLPFGLLSGDYFGNDADPVTIESGRCSATVVINGIWNDSAARQKLADAVKAAPRFAGSQVVSGVNQTSYVGDLIQIVGDELGLLQVTPLRIAAQINQIYNKFRANGCCCVKIQVLAHSQGAKVFERAASVLPSEVKRAIYVTTIGGQTTVSSSGFAGAQNFSNRSGCANRDWVSVIGNYNPFRIPRILFGGSEAWERVVPPASNWIEHSYDHYYKCLVNSLPADGPCVSIK